MNERKFNLRITMSFIQGSIIISKSIPLNPAKFFVWLDLFRIIDKNEKKFLAME